MKIDNGNKRKLSKRKDPEAAVDYFFEQGYIVNAVIDYLANIVDSSYEEWRKQNPNENFWSYHSFGIVNMPKSGALFDLVKLNSINKEYISVMSHEEFYEAGRDWAKEYDKELFALMEKYPDLTKAAMNIERLSEKDPKRFIKISDIKNQLLAFYPETYTELCKNCPAFPEHITKDVLVKFLSSYAEEYNPTLSKEDWFSHLKELGQTL
jgi:glutamyl-tRNA synthetase